MDLTPGAVIAGRYRVGQKVGSGGMGEVWSGEHRAVGSRVALKTLLSAAALNHEVVARFKREAMILGRIRSDHVARVVDFVADNEFGLVLVMEFIEGDSLSRVLSERLLTVEETIDLGVDVACALIDLHKAQIVHRDLKPGNIILQPLHGERRSRAVVVDFGVSRLLSGGNTNDEEEITGITKADMAVGTIEYMAPEQILNSRNVNYGSDIYALGAILYRAATGRHVFGNIASDNELANLKLTTEAPALALSRSDHLATRLTAVVMRALKRRPAERYKSAEQVLNDLRPLRDLARIAQVELDPTTIDQSAIFQALMAEKTGTRGTPAPAPPAARGSFPSIPTNPSAPGALRSSASGAGSFSELSLAPGLPPPRRGVPVAVLVGSVLAALAGGTALGAVVIKPKLDASAPIEATTLPAATASATATVAATAATATASAAPAAADVDASADAATSAAPAATASAVAWPASALKPPPTTATAPPVLNKPWPRPPTTTSAAPPPPPPPSGVPSVKPAPPDLDTLDTQN